MPAKKYLKNDQNHFFLCFISCLPIYLSTYLQIISNILNIIKVEELSPPSLFKKACMYDYLNLYCFLSMNQGSIVVSRYAQQLWMPNGQNDYGRLSHTIKGLVECCKRMPGFFSEGGVLNSITCSNYVGR